MTKAKQEPAEDADDPVFERDTCLYRAVKDSDESEARVFRKDEPVPDKSEGWRDHPSDC